MICPVDVADELLRLQSIGIEHRMMKRVMIVDQGWINIALGIQGNKTRVIFGQALQTVYPIGQINTVGSTIFIFGINP